MLSLAASPPIPVDPLEAARIDHGRLRYRLLSGLWADDLAQRMVMNLGSVRRAAIGEPDCSANPFEAMCSSAAALYDRAPEIRHSDRLALAVMRDRVAAAQLYALMPRVQRDTLGQREQFLRVDVAVDGRRVRPVCTPYRADLVIPVADGRDPSRPVEIRAAVLRDVPGGQAWVWDRWSIAGEPVHQILSADGSDWSGRFGLPEGGERGEAYLWRRADGRPVLPWATYHAARTGYLLDPWYKQELVQGTLNVGVLWTFFTHCVRAASWPQRWISGGFVGGATEDGGVRRIVADPATILEILKDPDFDGQVSAGQWGSASDPKAVAEAISVYEARFAGYAGLDPSDLQRVNGDPRSGVALAVSTAGRRNAQRRYEPLQAPVDAEVLELIAIGMNVALGQQVLPEEGWSLRYAAIEPTVEERKAEREGVLEQLRQGLISKAEARAKLLGEDLVAATEALAAMAAADAGGDQALASTQAQALVNVASAVARGELTASGAVAILQRSYGLGADEAARMVDGAEALAATRTIPDPAAADSGGQVT